MPEPLLSTDELSRLQQQVLEQGNGIQRTVTSPHIGPHRSHYRGQGMELHDVRAYQAGDDIRHMDWRATARSGKPTTKVFIEERQRSLFLVVDRRTTMQFGTRTEIKAKTAARTALILAFTALAARENIAGIIIEDDMSFFPAARTLEGTLPLAQAINAPLKPAKQHAPNKNTTDISSLCELISHRAEHGTTICLISDFHDYSETADTLLRSITNRFETHAYRIIDHAEETLDKTGLLRFISPHTGKMTIVNTDDDTLRRRYSEAMSKQSINIQQLCLRAGIALQTIYNHQDTFQQLHRPA